MNRWPVVKWGWLILNRFWWYDKVVMFPVNLELIIFTGALRIVAKY
jgi:hypothetical protein